MNTTRKQALAEILGAMRKTAANFEVYGEPEYLTANTNAMLKLAIAYSVVKRGVILPTYLFRITLSIWWYLTRPT